MTSPTPNALTTKKFGQTSWTIEYLAVVLKDHLPALTKPVLVRIRQAIEEKIAVDPISFGKPLQYSLKGHRRLRVGDYRIIYRIEPESHVVLIIAIMHRKDIYEQ